MSTTVPIVDASSTPFSSCVAYQKTSTELVIYSRTAKSIVTIAWPTHNDVPIVPTGIKAYLRTRGLFWECFCGLVSSVVPRPSRIVVSNVTGDVFVFCHFEHSHCNFRINLSELRPLALLQDGYSLMPTLRSEQKPAIDDLLYAFRLRDYPVVEIAPYFQGYCGEHISAYPAGTKQLSGPFFSTPSTRRNRFAPTRPVQSHFTRMPQNNNASSSRYIEIDDSPAPDPSRSVSATHGHKRIRLMRTTASAPAVSPFSKTFEEALSMVEASLGTSHAGPSASQAGPSTSQAGRSASHAGPRISHAGPSESRSEEAANDVSARSLKCLKRLEDGGGLSEEQWSGFFEECGRCGQHFLADTIKKHLAGCMGKIIMQ
ncbi:hypothetical protein Hypma_006548 [Hypsizygus marmoreus]|uniref:Uncharacterized protein n=1 Tax=Hypsizygus marmoreus TaxID=39966 RepID=A0A369JXW1_HYPMA|nr:hypothetical protein Hypma_006548 [Hypsizygus marmoreus]